MTEEMKNPNKKMSKKKKWMIGIGVLLIIGFIGSTIEDEEEIESDVAEAEKQAEIDAQHKEDAMK